jgi:hypothetical protein
MISHFVGNPHGPSLSFPVFSCGPVVDDAFATGAAPFDDVVLLLLCVVVVVVSATTALFSVVPSSHGCALATAS